MKACIFLTYSVVLVVATAQPSYKYTHPERISHSQPRPSNTLRSPLENNIYAAVQSLPLVQFNVPEEHHRIFSLQQQALVQQGHLAQQYKSQSNIAPAAEVHSQTNLRTQSVPQQKVLQQPLSAVQTQTYQQQLTQPQKIAFQTPLEQALQNMPQRPRTEIITKDIYIHSAPEESDSGLNSVDLDNTPIRKNYRIVFIKAPTQNLGAAAAALKRAQAVNEEKTVIYVLSKKPDLSEVHQQLHLAQIEQKTNKPEVYFIKYKTQEEAVRAQQQIQAQYDALGGSTHISDEGIAPITTFPNSANLSAAITPIHAISQSASRLQSLK